MTRTIYQKPTISRNALDLFPPAGGVERDRYARRTVAAGEVVQILQEDETRTRLRLTLLALDHAHAPAQPFYREGAFACLSFHANTKATTPTPTDCDDIIVTGGSVTYRLDEDVNLYLAASVALYDVSGDEPLHLQLLVENTSQLQCA